MYFMIAVLIIIIVFAGAFYIVNKKDKNKQSRKQPQTNTKKTKTTSNKSEIDPGCVFTEKELNSYIDPKTPAELVKYSIPPSFSILDNHTLKNCTNLTELYIHDKMFLLENNSFINCVNLININVHEDNKNYCSKLGVLFAKESRDIICYPSAKQSSTYFIPQEVEKIDNHAFTNNKFLKYIILPNTVTTICENAFVNCKLLKQIVIPDTVTTIHPRAFNMCPRLSIRGYKGSVAEQYCKKYFIPFEYLTK